MMVVRLVRSEQLSLPGEVFTHCVVTRFDTNVEASWPRLGQVSGPTVTNVRRGDMVIRWSHSLTLSQEYDWHPRQLRICPP